MLRTCWNTHGFIGKRSKPCCFWLRSPISGPPACVMARPRYLPSPMPLGQGTPCTVFDFKNLLRGTSPLRPHEGYNLYYTYFFGKKIVDLKLKLWLTHKAGMPFPHENATSIDSKCASFFLYKTKNLILLRRNGVWQDLAANHGAVRRNAVSAYWGLHGRSWPCFWGWLSERTLCPSLCVIATNDFNVRPNSQTLSIAINKPSCVGSTWVRNKQKISFCLLTESAWKRLTFRFSWKSSIVQTCLLGGCFWPIL